MTTTDQFEAPVASELVNLLAEVSAEGHPDLFAGKRERFRYWTSRRFEARYSGDGGEVACVTLRNISATGLALWSRQKIKRDTLIRIRAYGAADDAASLEALVLHCSGGVGGYLIGARFVNPLPAHVSPEVREPVICLGAVPLHVDEPASRPGFLARLFGRRGDEA